MSAPSAPLPAEAGVSAVASARRGSRWRVAALVLGVLVVVLLGGVRLRYGGGTAYRDLSGAPLLPESALEVVVTSQEPIGNVAVSAEGRVFYTIHPESRPAGARLLEWVNGQPRPYPSEQQQALFQTVLGVRVDRQNRLWTIDHGNHGAGQPRLLAFDLATGSVVHDFTFPSEVAPLGSFLQDFQVDSQGETVYIADVAFWRRSPALVVYDVGARKARRLLERHASVFPQDYIIHHPSKDMVFFGGLAALKAGVDGIAIDRQDEWLYYAAMNHDTLYRVRTADLRDSALSAEQLAERVQPVGAKPLNDGLSTDAEGNVLVTDVEHGAVLRMSPEGKLETLVKTPRIRWADGLSYGPEDWLYLADSDIPDQMLQSKEHIAAHAPYYIYRFKPGVGGVPGQ